MAEQNKRRRKPLPAPFTDPKPPQFYREETGKQEAPRTAPPNFPKKGFQACEPQKLVTPMTILTR